MDQGDARHSIFLAKDICVNAPQTLPMTHQALPIRADHPAIGCEARPGGKMEVGGRARNSLTQLPAKSFGVPSRFFPEIFA
jgi:hypothetical protein